MLGPGPQSFVGVKSDNTPSEMSGDSDVGHRRVCQQCYYYFIIIGIILYSVTE